MDPHLGPMVFLTAFTNGAERLGDYSGVCSSESGLNAVSLWNFSRPHSASGEESRHKSSEAYATNLGPQF